MKSRISTNTSSSQSLGKGYDYVMAGFANVEINIFSGILLLILFISVFRRCGEYLPDQKLFVFLLISTAMLLLTDSMQWILDGKPDALSRNTNLIATGIYYTIEVLPAMLWCLYVRYEFTMDIQETMKTVKLFAVLFAANAVFSILSCFYGMFFYIDENNFYRRGDWFWVNTALIYCFMVYASAYVVVNRKKLEKNILLSLLAFPLPPILGSVIQIAHFGIALIWPGVALSLVIVYIYVQKNQLYTDHLTGLYNRRLLDIRLDSYLKKSGEVSSIGVIMLDINDFKSINDALGHVVGDQALVETANILKKSISREGFIARYGGDEFVAVVPAKGFSDIEHIVNEIQRNIALYNNRDNSLFSVTLSVGYEIFECCGAFSRTEVLSSIDRRMYKDKTRC